MITHNKNQFKDLQRLILALGLMLIIYMAALAVMMNKELLVDEYTHYHQIINFRDKNFYVLEDLTTIPGYHLVMAVVSLAINHDSIRFFRVVNGFFGIASSVIFLSLFKEINHHISVERLIQYSLLPILFPFHFLIYTDTLSLLLVLSGIYLALEKRFNLSGFVLFLSLLVRQNNIIWLFLAFIIYCLDFCANKLRANKSRSLSQSNFLGGGLVFILGIISFGVFVYINRGVALGDKLMHPGNELNPGNIFFFLFLYFFLFLPSILKMLFDLSNKRKIGKSTYLYLLGLLVSLYLIYMFKFDVVHPYNVEWQDYFLRNKLLGFMVSSPLSKTLYFIPMGLSVIHIYQRSISSPQLLLLFCLIAIFLMPSSLIEQRYYIIPFSLLIATFPVENRSIEIITCILYLALSSIFVFLINSGRFFL